MSINTYYGNAALLGGSYGAGSTATSAAGGVNAAALALQRANARVQSQLDATTAQLSAFGKLKSAVSDAQLAGRALGSLSASSGSTDIGNAVLKFLNTFNSAVTTAAATAALPGTNAEAVAASRAGNDMRRSLGASIATLDALKKLGFTSQGDGTLALDTAKFAAALKADPGAVRATLAKAGHLVDVTAAKELADTGNVKGSMSSLSQRSTTLQAQQGALAKSLSALAGTSAGGAGYTISTTPTAADSA